jgi:6-phosphogluconolactonase (cycloisomerase 2 family)
LAAATLAACTEQSATAPVSVRAIAAAAGTVGAVYTSTNDASANAVVAFHRGADGALTPVGSFATGGAGIGGTADPLQSQFALTLSRDRQFLFVVNAGTNDVSAFRVDNGGLTLVDRVPSGGVRPVSVAAGNGTLYALNLMSNTVVGFAVGTDGRLTPIAGAAKALSAGASGAAAVRLSPDGHLLAVTERLSRTIDTYVVAPDGSLSGPITTASSGVTPFGFDFTPRGQLVVSEAGSGSASSYAADASGSLTPVSAAVPTLQRAPCWLIVDNAGRFAYTANAGSATISAFAVGANGALALLGATGVAGDLGAGAQPLDLDLSRDGRFLYVFENGKGAIGGFAVNGNGSLTALADTPGLPVRGGYMGLAAY